MNVMKTAVLIITGLVTLSCGTAFAQSTDSYAPIPGASLEQQTWDRNFSISGNEGLDLNDPLLLQEKGQSFQFGGGGRWRMNLETVTRADDSPLPREEMRAGATYQFTPRFSLGGSVSLGAEELDDVSTWKEQDVKAGVRLKTTFKF
tara:strand:+ start:139 stop:579 length:441 start_codon:yes stop_codon:yes gene_type:complete